MTRSMENNTYVYVSYDNDPNFEQNEVKFEIASNGF